MTIDQNIFRDNLSKAFIELLNSKRGVATELARAIGKPSSFVSQVKRGRPVNSIHLKAVGIVFGSQKVIELLEIEDTQTQKVSIDKNSSYEKMSKIPSIKNQNLVTRFKDSEKGLENSEYLIGIEQASDDLYKKVSDYLKTTHDTAQIMKKEDHKKTS